MLAFPKSPLPCHGPQGGLHSSSSSSFHLGVNDKGPRPFQRFGFGSQQRMPLSPARPRQGGLQNSALSVCWAKKKKAKELPNNQQKAIGFGKKATKVEGPSVQQESKTGDGKTEALEKLIISENFSERIDGIYDHMPPECDLAWKESQQAWVDHAINHPITLNSGECTVYLLGICHNLPTNASALRALVDAVQPDTIAIEEAPQNSKRYRVAAQELAPQLDKLMALEFPVGIKEAHMALSPQDRCRWREVIFEGELALLHGGFTEEETGLLLFGKVPMIEFLAATRLAPSGNGGISLEGIDMEARTKERRLVDNPGHQQEYWYQMGQILGPENLKMLHEKGPEEAFDEWQENVADMNGSLGDGSFMNGLVPILQNTLQFLKALGFASMCPGFKGKHLEILKEAETHLTGTAAAYAQALRDDRNLQMMERLEKLAEGRWSAGGPLRPRKVIVAVVGSHVAPMQELAARKKM
eukprot:gene31827-biopygen6680